MAISGGLIASAGVSAWGAFQIWPGWEIATGVGATITIIAIGAWFWGRRLLKIFSENLKDYETLDQLFADTFRNELALQDRTDLNIMWSGLKETAQKTFTILKPKDIPNFFSMSRSIRKLEGLLDSDIPKLRRAISETNSKTDPKS